MEYMKKPQLLQKAPENFCDETGLLLFQPRDQYWFTRTEAVAKAAGSEERSLNLNRLWERAGTFTIAMKTWPSL